MNQYRGDIFIVRASFYFGKNVVIPSTHCITKPRHFRRTIELLYEKDEAIFCCCYDESSSERTMRLRGWMVGVCGRV